MPRDYYELLGLSRHSTEKEIRTAFRKLARKHHPDVNPGQRDAEARFKEINEAHEVLSDPKTRMVIIGDDCKTLDFDLAPPLVLAVLHGAPDSPLVKTKICLVIWV